MNVASGDTRVPDTRLRRVVLVDGSSYDTTVGETRTFDLGIVIVVTRVGTPHDMFFPWHMVRLVRTFNDERGHAYTLGPPQMVEGPP